MEESTLKLKVARKTFSLSKSFSLAFATLRKFFLVVARMKNVLASKLVKAFCTTQWFCLRAYVSLFEWKIRQNYAHLW